MAVNCIDVFCHCLPPGYCAEVTDLTITPPVMIERAQHIPAMVNLSARLRVMDMFPGYRQIVSLASPPVEALAADHSVRLAQVANDEMAQLVDQSDQRICGFVATLPLNDVDASCQEAQRAIQVLGAVGVQVYTSVEGRPLDGEEFHSLFATVAELNQPILLHPIRPSTMPDYPSEERSRWDMWWALGWPYETTLALCRLALAGTFDRWPKLKIIAHHVGGYLPMLSGRLGPGMELLGTRQPPSVDFDEALPLQEPLVRACQRFYVDTASFGSRAAIECGQAFFGTDHLLFASDMPFDPEQGPGYIRTTLSAIDQMELSPDQRYAVLAGNAQRLFQLSN